MSTNRVVGEVEFIGGPIDGHIESCDESPAPFIAASVSPPGRISRIKSWLRQLVTRNHGERTVAIYELHETNGGLRYRHAGSSASLPRSLPRIRVDVSTSTGGKRHGVDDAPAAITSGR
jgi:hypothetical protein